MYRNFLTFSCVIFLTLSCVEKKLPTSASIKETMDGVVSRLYQSHTENQLDTIGHDYLLTYLTESEKESLSNQYWQFDVNVPVVVSLMRHVDQKTIPFWLAPSGFTKTDLLVRNQEYTYEVWQKNFDAGRVKLGINGFDKHRPVYFISVGPTNADDVLEITNPYPDNQHYETLQSGAFTYHDWDELTINELPEELNGQVLFTTIRGRAREAHLIGAFRKTPFVSGPVPDQVLLTWSDDPSTTMDIQWRTDVGVKNGTVHYWPEGFQDAPFTAEGTKYLLEDRLLQNDRYVHRFTAQLKNLQPGIKYQYIIEGSDEFASFQTAPDKNEPFSFIWFGDTHKSEKWGDLLKESFQRHPKTAFYSIAGDVVSTGLNRDDWDALFNHAGNVFAHKPLMPVPGNHDNQDGLGAWMYQEMFSLPKNGPQDVGTELTYSFKYSNALFLMMDVTAPIDAQTEWIEDQLSNSDALWTFAVFHFPPYSWEEDYPVIREKWCSLFDQYHVDMVMSGHVHYYMRSKPMNNEQVVDRRSDGTVYVISVGIPSRTEKMPVEHYAVIQNSSGWLYQHMEIDNGALIYQAIDMEGHIIDEFTIEK